MIHRQQWLNKIPCIGENYYCVSTNKKLQNCEVKNWCKIPEEAKYLLLFLM